MNRDTVFASLAGGANSTFQNKSQTKVTENAILYASYIQNLNKKVKEVVTLLEKDWSSMAQDALNDLVDYEEERKDPYAYRGLSRSDF